MGRGKSTAAFRHINENVGKLKFLFVTPYLEEVDRACVNCEFIQPSSTSTKSKLGSLVKYMHQGKNVALTHELFKRFTMDVAELVRERGYHLILDEVFDATENLDLSIHDVEILEASNIIDISSDDGKISWRFGEYDGSLFKDVYDMTTRCAAYCSSKKVFSKFNPDIFRAFESVHILTYLFKGSPFEAYLKSCELEYEIVGIDRDDGGVKLSDKPDNPPPMDIKKLITIVDNKKWNKIGDNKFALSKSWYTKNCSSKSSAGARSLGYALRAFYTPHKGEDPIAAEDRMWCTFADRMEFVSKACRPTGGAMFVSDFVSLNIRATNKYSHCKRLAYLVNRFENPNIKQFYASLGYKIDDNQVALSEMVQWIWRSAIRNGQPITVFIPSSRMRSLFKRWLDSVDAASDINDIYIEDKEVTNYYEDICEEENVDKTTKQVDENIEIIEEKAQKRAQKSASFFNLIDGAVNSIAGTSTYLGTESVRVRTKRTEMMRNKALSAERRAII